MQRAVDLALRALAPVIPDKITAGNSAHLGFLAYSGFNEEEGEYWVYLEVDEGSYGGRPGRDGLDSVDCLIANTRNNPIEELEWRFPMRTERYELRDDPCAAGKWRGGIGMVRVNRFLVDTIVSCEGDRYESDPPWGIFGGHDGHARLRQGDEARRDGRVLAGEVHRQDAAGRLHDRARRAELRRLRRPARARPRSRALRRARRLHDDRARRARLRRRARSRRPHARPQSDRAATRGAITPGHHCLRAPFRERTKGDTCQRETRSWRRSRKIFNADTGIYQQRGFQRRIGFGSRPALVHIDLANAWTRPGNAFSCDKMDMIIPAVQRLNEAGRAKGIPIVYTTTAYTDIEGPNSDMGLWVHKIPVELLKSATDAVAIDDRIAPRPGRAW